MGENLPAEPYKTYLQQLRERSKRILAQDGLLRPKEDCCLSSGADVSKRGKRESGTKLEGGQRREWTHIKRHFSNPVAETQKGAE